MSSCLFSPLDISLDNLVMVRQIYNNKLKIINTTLSTADYSSRRHRISVRLAWPNFIFILLATTAAIKLFIG